MANLPPPNPNNQKGALGYHQSKEDKTIQTRNQSLMGDKEVPEINGAADSQGGILEADQGDPPE